MRGGCCLLRLLVGEMRSVAGDDWVVGRQASWRAKSNHFGRAAEGTTRPPAAAAAAQEQPFTQPVCTSEERGGEAELPWLGSDTNHLLVEAADGAARPARDVVEEGAKPLVLLAFRGRAGPKANSCLLFPALQANLRGLPAFQPAATLALVSSHVDGVADRSSLVVITLYAK